MIRTFNRGDLVYDKADPRHVGRIDKFMHTNTGCFVCIVWLKTGWKSFKVPTCRLERAKEDFI